MRNHIIKYLFYVVGLIIVSFGIALTIKSNLGAGAWDALNVGLSTSTGLTVGQWVMIVGAILILTNALLGKQRPDYLAFFTIFIIGSMIDFWLLIVMENWSFETFINQFIILIIGVITLSFGIAAYLQPKLPLIPIDGFMVAVQKRFGIGITFAKTMTEMTALILAFIFGGPIGIGTIIIIFLIGPTIQFFDPKAGKLLDSLLKK